VFGIPQVVVGDTRAAYGELCHAFAGHPSQQLKVIAVAGTHGKTTVARLLTSIFREAGASAGTLDSLGYWDGHEDRDPLDEGLSSPLVARSLAEMNAAGLSHAIIEVNSRELSQSVLAGVVLDSVCLTQIGRGSLDWHGSLENYRAAERRVLSYLSPVGVLLVNADDPTSMQVLSEWSQPVLTFGLKNPSEIAAEIIEQHVNEQTFILTAGDDSAAVRTEIIGDHHVQNCLAAAATALAYGIELTTIARGLEAVDRLPGRMERVTCGQDFAVFVDAAESPDALRASLRAARQATDGRVICVVSPPGEREAADRAALGRVAGAMADVAFVTSETKHDETPRDVLCEVRRGFAKPSSARLIANRVRAIAAALSEAQPGDTVVITGSRYGAERELVRKQLQAPAIAPVWPRLAA
jgi:UDP-N-acetylmuramoyl-L-alanyl-D-glutamate--2,6-diaminopimelate ligase